MKSEDGWYNKAFSHLYVESAVKNHETTRQIRKHFPDAQIVEIEHYKDLFGRSRQDFSLQKEHPAFILAKTREHAIYSGAPVCQSFGNVHFYYTSCVMNCIYDCEYCYLRGMYPSGNIVIFVDIEETFAQVEELLKVHPVYLCVSYDTDLLALESLTGFVKKWSAFTRAHENLTIEIRTKCPNAQIFSTLPSCERVIFAYTFSPDEIARLCEKRAGTFPARLSAASEAAKSGHPLRLCIDPILRVGDWKTAYRKMIDDIFFKIPPEKILDVSIGTFRISAEYLKKMRKASPDSRIVQYPYVNENGYYQYPREERLETEQTIKQFLSEKIDESKIFGWKE